MTEVPESYIEGAKEGRSLLKRLIADGVEVDAKAMAERLRAAYERGRRLEHVSVEHDDFLRGELHFWEYQASKG